jgi:hypothetical protein
MAESTKVENKLFRSLGMVIGDPEPVLIYTYGTYGPTLQGHDKRISRHLWGKYISEALRSSPGEPSS